MTTLNVYRVVAFGRTGYKATDSALHNAVRALTGKAYMTKEHLTALETLGLQVSKVAPPDID